MDSYQSSWKWEIQTVLLTDLFVLAEAERERERKREDQEEKGRRGSSAFHEMKKLYPA
jgi:hypothetical protein